MTEASDKVKARRDAENAELDERANVLGVDVVFAADGGGEQLCNLFAIVVDDTAVVVHGGRVTKLVTRKSFARGTFKKHDLHEYARLFGG